MTNKVVLCLPGKETFSTHRKRVDELGVKVLSAVIHMSESASIQPERATTRNLNEAIHFRKYVVKGQDTQYTTA